MKKNLAITFFLLTINISLSFCQNDALKILPNGNVGVGTSNPIEKLQVSGNIKADGQIQDKTGSVMPIGSVIAFAGTEAPDGWLLCDGKSYPTNGDTNDLYKVIGNIYGGVDGQFNVPDLRETFVMGANMENRNEQSGKKGDADKHSHVINAPEKSFTTSSNGKHTHKFNSVWYKRMFGTNTFGSGYSGIDTGGKDIKDQTTESDGNHSHVVNIALPAFKSAESTERNRPKWMALNYIIKY